MNGDAEKALEWFLGQSSDATESSPVDEENSGLPEYGKRARNLDTFVPEDESVPSDTNTIVSLTRVLLSPLWRSRLSLSLSFSLFLLCPHHHLLCAE
jgi:hypothetical protein